jgi:germination protein M
MLGIAALTGRSDPQEDTVKRTIAPVLLGLVFALLLTACGSGVTDAGPIAVDDEIDATESPADTESPSDDPTDSPTSDDDSEEPTTDPADEEARTTSVRLYYLAPGGETRARSGPFIVAVQREIPSTPRIALATLRELVDGPSTDDRDHVDDISTAVPDDTLVLDVAIDDGLATVDLSREFESGGGSFSMTARLAQVVYTVTQFPTVDEVEFELDGQPVTVFSGEGIVLDEPVARDDYHDLLPTVFVDSPAAGATLGDGGRITGMAAVFEATFQYRIEAADGTVLAEDYAMTDNGTGWGAFDFTVDLDIPSRQDGTLTVFEYSAEDGSVQAERTTPVTLVP